MVRISALAAVVLGLAVSGGVVRGEVLPLTKLDMKLVEILTTLNGAGAAVDKSVTGRPIKIGGKEYAKGIGLRGVSRMEVALDEKGKELRFEFGVTDDNPAAEKTVQWVEVIADGKMVFEGPEMKMGDKAVAVKVPLAGVKRVVIAVQQPDGLAPHSALADCEIEYEGEAPKAVKRDWEEAVVLTPAVKPEPRVNGAMVYGVRPGSEVIYRVAASGERPMKFSAKGLPAGVTFDEEKGILRGAVAEKGTYPIELTATNSKGSATRVMKLVVGDKLALTPPMGWNSWNGFAEAVTQDVVKEAADLLEKEGLVNHGWSWVNLDDAWATRPAASDPIYEQLALKAKAINFTFLMKPPAKPEPHFEGKARDERGRILPNSRFPDMKGMVDYIHSKGLKAGVYSSPGALTCGKFIGSLGYEKEDAAQFAEWGFDLLKYDWCGYRYEVSRASNVPVEELKTPYQVMGDALKAQKRDIVYSLCQYGMGDVWEWGDSVGGDLWRTTRDDLDSWPSISGIGFMQNGREKHAGPGAWNDQDLMVIGWVGWGSKRHPTGLSPNEQYTHVSMWVLGASPLIVGNDLTKLDPFTKSLMTNDEIIDINQDPLGKAAYRVKRQRNLEVWAKPMEDGSVAVGLFNRGEVAAKISFKGTEVGLSGVKRVRDVWRQADVQAEGDGYGVEVPRHGVVVVRVW